MAVEFPNLSSEKLEEANSNDSAIAKIASCGTPTTFDWMRASFKSDNGLKDELKYGTAVLPTPDHLNQYLYTYGLMIQSQWRNLATTLSFIGKPIRIIDYGAGQGLAGLLISDNFGDKFRSCVEVVTIIEPSIPGLVRCAQLYQNLFENAQITCLNDMLDDVEAGHFPSSNTTTLHLFSNILDVPGFDQGALFNKTFTNGNHVIIAVSHDRNFAGGSGRIRAIEEEVRKSSHSAWLTVHSSTISEFECGTGGKFDAISWVAELTVER